MALTVTGVSPAIIAIDGGYRLEIVGTFTLGNPYRCYVGLEADPGFSLCHPGVPGQADVCYPVTSTLLVAYSPFLTIGDNQGILVIDDNTETAVGLESCLDVIPENYYSSVFSIRSLLPPHWKTGPRGLDRVP